MPNLLVKLKMEEKFTNYIENKKKICFVLRSHYKYRLGGAELQAHFIARELYRTGWEVHYVFDKSGILQQGFDNGLVLHNLRDYGSSHCFLNYLSLKKKLQEINPDIIYQRMGFAYTGAVARFAKTYNKKFVWATSHVKDCEKKRFISSLKEYDGNLLKKFLLAIEYGIHDYLCDYGIKNANVIVVQTKEQKDLLAKNWGVESTIIKNGHLVPTKLPQKENPPIVLWLASLKRQKQAEKFIKLARRCKELNCKFILAGRSLGKGYLEELLQQMQGLPNIEYFGGVTFEESNELIGCASVFVNTSKYEGFPNTFIQAWMRETPTVSLNVDPDDVIKKNKLGFHSGSFEQMVKDVRFLMQNKRVRQEMGRNARKYAIREHDFRKIAPKYIELIEEMVKK